MNDLPTRKRNRLIGYDYSKNGAYFITICVKNRHNILGQVESGGDFNIPQVQLSLYGKYAEKHILRINEIYKNIFVDKYIIMPNHIHMIVLVSKSESGMSRAPSPTNALIPNTISTCKRFINMECGFNIFQRSYHDHIIRNEKEFYEISQYIETNPLKWSDDCFFTEI